MLYVLSAYLVNVKSLSEEEALQVVQEFLENSCRSYGSYGKIYESFIRGDLRRVKIQGPQASKPGEAEREIQSCTR